MNLGRKKGGGFVGWDGEGITARMSCVTRVDKNNPKKAQLRILTSF